MLRALLPNPAPRASAGPVGEPGRTGWTLLLPLALLGLLYLAASTGPALFDQNEAQYAGAVREMMNRPADYTAATRGQLERGQWWIPTNDGMPRLQKPPLVYWTLLASMRTFGVNEFAARLPNALCTLLWLGATFLLGRRIGGDRLGAAAALVLGTMAGTFIFTHLIAPEPFLAAFLTLTFWCFLSAHREPARAGRWMFLAWVFMGLGVDSKGLHGALYPLAVAGGLAWRRPGTRPVWRKLLHPAGPLLVLALLAPWYAAVEARFPGFLYDQFINEQWGHVINRRFPVDSSRVPLAIFCLEHLAWFLPWTFFIPAAWQHGRRGRGSVDTEVGPGRAGPVPGKRVDGSGSLGWSLLGWWFGVTMATLLFSSLQDYYLLTAWAPVAFFLARLWTEGEDGGRSLPRWARLGPGWGMAGLGGVVLAAGAYLAWRGGADAVTSASSAARNTTLSTLTGFSASAWHQLLPVVWLAGGSLVGGGLTMRFLAASGRWPSVLTTAAVTMIVLLGLAARGMGMLEDYFSLKRLALTANRLADAETIVVCDGELDENPSLLFYLNREIYWLHAHAAMEFASRELRIGTRLFLEDGEFLNRWKSDRQVLLICEADEVGPWRNPGGLLNERGRVLEQRGTRVLVVNRSPR